jgi:regulator of nonsense transcripts 1
MTGVAMYQLQLHVSRTVLRLLSKLTTCLRALSWILLQWQPIIEDRQFVKWMVKVPNEEEKARALRLSPQQVRRSSSRQQLAAHSLVACS